MIDLSLCMHAQATMKFYADYIFHQAKSTYRKTPRDRLRTRSLPKSYSSSFSSISSSLNISLVQIVYENNRPTYFSSFTFSSVSSSSSPSSYSTDPSGSLSSGVLALEDLGPVFRFFVGVPAVAGLARDDLAWWVAPAEEDAPSMEVGWRLRSLA